MMDPFAAVEYVYDLMMVGAGGGKTMVKPPDPGAWTLIRAAQTHGALQVPSGPHGTLQTVNLERLAAALPLALMGCLALEEPQPAGEGTSRPAGAGPSSLSPCPLVSKNYVEFVVKGLRVLRALHELAAPSARQPGNIVNGREGRYNAWLDLVAGGLVSCLASFERMQEPGPGPGPGPGAGGGEPAGRDCIEMLGCEAVTLIQSLFAPDDLPEQWEACWRAVAHHAKGAVLTSAPVLVTAWAGVRCMANCIDRFQYDEQGKPVPKTRQAVDDFIRIGQLKKISEMVHVLSRLFACPSYYHRCMSPEHVGGRARRDANIGALLYVVSKSFSMAQRAMENSKGKSFQTVSDDILLLTDRCCNLLYCLLEEKNTPAFLDLVGSPENGWGSPEFGAYMTTIITCVFHWFDHFLTFLKERSLNFERGTYADAVPKKAVILLEHAVYRLVEVFTEDSLYEQAFCRRLRDPIVDYLSIRNNAFCLVFFSIYEMSDTSLVYYRELEAAEADGDCISLSRREIHATMDAFCENFKIPAAQRAGVIYATERVCKLYKIVGNVHISLTRALLAAGADQLDDRYPNDYESLIAIAVNVRVLATFAKDALPYSLFNQEDVEHFENLVGTLPDPRRDPRVAGSSRFGY